MNSTVSEMLRGDKVTVFGIVSLVEPESVEQMVSERLSSNTCNAKQELSTSSNKTYNKKLCNKARRDFIRYLKNLDQSLFTKACKLCNGGFLHEFDAMIMDGTNELPKLLAYIDIFLENVDKAIEEEITRLKNLKTSKP